MSQRLRNSFALLLALLVLSFTPPARAHVGNKDIFEQVQAGPYTLFVTIRTPQVIPGVATVEVRTSGAAVSSLTIAPMMLTGEASKHPPTADTLTRSTDDPSFFSGSVWLMATGSWQVRLTADGASGPATASVPVPAAALSMLRMDKGMGTILAALGLLLIVGAVGIVMASTREARLEPGTQPTPDRNRLAISAGITTLVLMLGAVWLGGKWWNVEAADYASGIWHASEMRPVLHGSLLTVTIGDPDKKARGGWRAVEAEDLLPDHGKLMHLYAIRIPEMDAAFHLHPQPDNTIILTPEQTEAVRRAIAQGRPPMTALSGKNGALQRGLSESLPAMPPGTYKLFADIVYRNGFPETETATLNIPAGLSTAPLAVDDASAAPPPLSAGELGTSYKLPDGYSMVWAKPATIDANRGYAFQFTLLDKTGKPATDVEPYLGMPGHAAFVKTDLTAFAHTHPEGSAAMPAMMLANASTSAGQTGSDMTLGSSQSMPDMPGMVMKGADMSSMPGMAHTALSPMVSFPYGFPSPGRYRIFIQMKHAGTVETGVFDAEVK
ncbi:hypothetical protein SAMN05421819_2234 [Bryocella elongata]|uniref:YtkA-like n=1 Tax=Bryocella elongata TaxID=863522 RepID=A0A1H5YCZ0_9BACT|nr:hypothetical protein [Bryocella elongata]SEG21595.1 hypothetical protein SAMN05421819_2234 [Bryocella elongata]